MSSACESCGEARGQMRLFDLGQDGDNFQICPDCAPTRVSPAVEQKCHFMQSAQEMSRWMR